MSGLTPQIKANLKAAVAKHRSKGLEQPLPKDPKERMLYFWDQEQQPSVRAVEARELMKR